jgi:long-chain fatty acid transport protein
VKWDQNERLAGDTSAAGRAGVDGPQRWHNISGRVTALYNTLALAYRIEPLRLSFGVSGSLVLNNVESTRARNANGSDDVTSPSGALSEGRSYLKVSSVNFAMSAGVHWEPLPNGKLRIGASYLIPPNFGEFRMKGELNQVFGTDRIPPAKTDVEFLQQLPDVIRFGVASRFRDNVEIRADATYERWSVVKRNCIVKYAGAACNVDATGSGDESQIWLNLPRLWKDSFAMRLGGSYWFNEPTEFFGSVGFGTSAVPKARMDVSAFDATQLFLTLGVKREFIRGLSGALSLNYIHYVPVDVAAGESQLPRYQSPSKSPSADGRYEVQVYYLNANVSYKF